jgi:hypothetical protein
MGTSVERPQPSVEVESAQLADSSLSVTELTLLSLNKAYRSAYATLSSALGWYGISMSKVRPFRTAALLVSGRGLK